MARLRFVLLRTQLVVNNSEIQEFLAEQNDKVLTLVELMRRDYGTKDTPTKIIKGITKHTLLEIIKHYHEVEKTKLETLVLEDRFSHRDEVFGEFISQAELPLLLTEYEKITRDSLGSKLFLLAHTLTHGRSTQEFFAKLNVQLPPLLVQADPAILQDINRAFFVLMVQEYS